MAITAKQVKAASKSYVAFQAELRAAMKQLKKLDQALRAQKASLHALSTVTAEAEILFDAAIRDAGGDSQEQLLQATKQMQETQMSFNLQYLQLQSQMQHENRSYTAVSNIMKTKHDTVKNSISNIR